MSKDVEGKDKHDEADWQPDHTGGLRPALCAECGTHIYLAPDAPTGLCLACARDQAGITWPSGQEIGHWHPTVGYERHLPPGEKPATPKPEWAWGCMRCLATGNALNADHAIAMNRMHDAYACPLQPGITEAETLLRVARRASLSRLNPEQTPWMTCRRDHTGRLTPVMGRP